ncbi:cytochrome P450 [Xylariaceae sp. FL0016]|nr:cytochrome P450 [Xylariaceae sp. FL0016]
MNKWLLLLPLCVLVSFWLGRASSTSKRKQHDQFWASIACVGVPHSGPLPWFRAIVKSFVCLKENAAEGYQKHCKERGLAFGLPIVGAGAIVTLAPSQLHVLDRSEGELLASSSQLEVIQPRWMIGDGDEMFRKTIMYDVVRRFLRNVGPLTADLHDEMDAAFCEYWGTESVGWKTVNAWDFCGRIIERMAGRVCFGLPLCRHEKLREQSRLYSRTMYAGADVINSLPAWLKPVLGPIVGFASKRYEASCHEILRPLVESRLQSFTSGKEDALPNDALQCIIEECARSGDDNELTVTNITKRLLVMKVMLTFGAAYTFASCILDLYSSNSKEDFVAGLREECDCIEREFDGLSDKAATDRLYRVDSAVRESLRLSPPHIISLPRDVAPGRTLNIGGGVQIPEGVRLAVPSYDILTDANFHEKPLVFDAFRFSRRLEGLDDPNAQASEHEPASSVTNTVPVFGYGRHGCPARWYVTQMMKQALAYVVQRYDVDNVRGNLEKKVLLNAVLPRETTYMSIRRRL